MIKGSILVVDDDASYGTYLCHVLRTAGYAVDAITNGDQLFTRLASERPPSLILLDVLMPGCDGIEVIERMKRGGVNIPVIMLSGLGQVRTVVLAMKLGASDFLMKPVSDAALTDAVRNAIERDRSIDAAWIAHLPAGDSTEFATVNPGMMRLAKIAKRVAPTDVPILITGESGVGKEVMARYAHAHSERSGKPFIKINCAALPNDLLESELFGYERGAFTGAVSDKPGKFELAHTGTLLLDEIGEMSPHLQSKLLHVLQDGSFTRLGASKCSKVDARIMASTNIDIHQAIADGRFREDLYFRLNVISIDLPPLRERREDIPALCNYFIAKYREHYKSQVRELPTELLNQFVQHDWPGNIRQLENFIKRFLVLPNHHALASEFEPQATSDQHIQSPIWEQPPSLLDVGANAADRAQHELVRRVLIETHGNRKQAAKRMNICYKALLNKLKRWSANTVPSNGPEESIAEVKAA
jgi:two-component system, NtrC family, response regulator AtoC